ncbi:unnamed protein product [Meloidogyne enterolobii]|uniref:Uncharacterized protein n=1 Tax=Meloidogyne enterolobii TaxID=390850 RepID=A0ACB1B3V2_MELEN
MDISLSPISTTISLKEEDISIPTPPLPALTSIIIEICNKFLFNHTKKPTLFLLMFNEYCDLLLFALEVNGSFAWKEQQKQIKENEKQQYTLLLENSEKILFEYLLNSSVISSTFPRGFNFQIKNKLKEKWEMFNQFLLNKNKNKDNYLNLLPDLSEEINLKEENVDVCGCKLILKNWLDKGKLLEKINDRTIEFDLLKQKPPWFEKPPIDQILSYNLLNILEMLISSILPKISNENLFLFANSDLCVILAENIADFLERISNEIGLTFAPFCIISIILSKFERCISFSLTNNSTRAIKQSLGILICSHPFINNLLLNLLSKNEDLWLSSLFKGLANLSVKCVAKGGALSLTGCAILQKLFVYLKNLKSKRNSNVIVSIEEILATNIWLASCYSLFPVRILISKFNINSNEGDMRVSYRLGLTPEEVEESVNKVRQLANQLFQFQNQISSKNQEENSSISPNFPGKFAYLFLLENNKNGGKLSMGLDELLDSLLCQQLIIQISTELILFENNNELLKTLILSYLNVTVEICEQFEERKGLGNLLQKLTG